MEKIFLINMKIPGAHLQIKTYVHRRESDRQTDRVKPISAKVRLQQTDRQTDRVKTISPPPTSTKLRLQGIYCLFSIHTIETPLCCHIDYLLAY